MATWKRKHMKPRPKMSDEELLRRAMRSARIHERKVLEDQDQRRR